MQTPCDTTSLQLQMLAGNHTHSKGDSFALHDPHPAGHSEAWWSVLGTILNNEQDTANMRTDGQQLPLLTLLCSVVLLMSSAVLRLWTLASASETSVSAEWESSSLAHQLQQAHPVLLTVT